MADYSSDDEKLEGDDALFEQLKGWFQPDNEKFKVWARGSSDNGAAEDFRFRDGDQWNEAEKTALQDQDRPVLVFNRTGVMVDAVVGSEIGNRREVRFIPRDSQDAKPNELLTSAAEWFRDLCDAEDEESEAFKDAVTGGMGWTDTRLDFDDNPAGEPKVDHFDPMEARWDADATKSNLVDTRRRWRVRKMTLADAKKLLPGHDDGDYNAAWADDESEEAGEPRHNDPGRRYTGKDEATDTAPTRKVTIVACQYYDERPFYKVILVGPEGMPQEAELDEEKFKIATEAGAILHSVKLKKRTVVQCFLGAKVLKAPKPTQTGTWTWNCITGLKDKERGVFYGIVRRAKDPQRWANKWLSQMMHILNSQAKGGIMAEAGAFENQRDAEANWARPEGITMLAKGSLTGPNGAKIQPKPVATFPAGFDRLLQYADEAIVKATGVNMELLGMREVNQPGVLEYQRKQSGIAILASLFDSLRRYRKIQGRAMLHLIQNFLSDGRLVRIVGEEEARYVPLTKEATADVEYDIIVDDSPTSTNEKEKTWQLLQGILPMFKDQLTGQHLLMLAEYSPLPTSLVEKLKSMGQEEPQDPTQNPAFMLEQAKLANEAKEIDLQMLQEQNKAKELDFKISEAQGKGMIAVMQDQTERKRVEVEGIEAMASLVEAQRPPEFRAN